MPYQRRRGNSPSTLLLPVAFTIAGLIVAAFVVYAVKKDSGGVPGAGKVIGFTAPVIAPPPSLTPLDSSNVLILGDSWTAAYGASDVAHGWATLAANALGWDVTIDGYPGAGFVRAAPAGDTFPTDFATAADAVSPSLVVVQGGTNDLGEPAAQIEASVSKIIAGLKARFPTAQLMFLGPMSPTTTNVGATRDVDVAMADAVSGAGIVYIDASAEQWFPTSKLSTYINVAAANHPSDAGHAQIAAMFEADFKKVTRNSG